MDIREKIAAANEQAVQAIIQSDPMWVDVLPASECVEGLTDHMVLHSGPPIKYENMCPLHKRSMVSGVLFERWAKNEDDARKLLESGEVKIESNMSLNSIGAGVGVVTPSMKLMVIEDKTSGKRAVTFFPEAEFQGGLCGWGLYSPEIANNIKRMCDYLFPTIRELILKKGGLPLKPILAESMQMGDENHTRQSAADLLFYKQVIPDLVRMDIPKTLLLDVMNYIVNTPRFFHGFGQSAARAALLAAEEIPYSTMVTALAGNGVEYGIKVAGLKNQWFTAPAPMMKGRYMSSKYSDEDQLPWMGDSCVVEAYGMGGIAAATSPIVCNLRGLKLKDAIGITREMEQITISKNYNFAIPNLDFDFLPVGIDIRKVLSTNISPVVHGGMFNREGGLIGVGSARVPMLCFEKAIKAFSETYLKK
ncbi:MAG: DUF1116 domain-containing protein [Acetivibrionales bacterium]|jgi:hypothetical protein